MRKPSPSLIIATIALFFSLTGAGLAAQHFIITSTSQIKPSVRQALRGERGLQGRPTGTTGVSAATLGAYALTQPTLRANTVRQPNATAATLVTISGALWCTIFVGATSTPGTLIAESSTNAPVTFLVPPGWYYKYVDNGATTGSITEFSLSAS